MERILSLALVIAVAAAGAFYLDAKAKADRIEKLEAQVLEQRADKVALLTVANALPQIDRRFRSTMAAINAAGDRTSEACLNDPRVRASNAALRLRYPTASDAGP